MKKGIKLFLLSGLAAFSLTCAMSCSNPTNPEKPGTEGESGTNPGENQNPGGGESEGGGETTESEPEIITITKGRVFVDGTNTLYQYNADGKSYKMILNSNPSTDIQYTFTVDSEAGTIKNTAVKGKAFNDMNEFTYKYEIATDKQSITLTPEGSSDKNLPALTLTLFDVGKFISGEGRAFTDGAERGNSKYVFTKDAENNNKGTIAMTLNRKEPTEEQKYSYTYEITPSDERNGVIEINATNTGYIKDGAKGEVHMKYNYTVTSAGKIDMSKFDGFTYVPADETICPTSLCFTLMKPVKA